LANPKPACPLIRAISQKELPCIGQITVCPYGRTTRKRGIVSAGNLLRVIHENNYPSGPPCGKRKLYIPQPLLSKWEKGSRMASNIESSDGSTKFILVIFANESVFSQEDSMVLPIVAEFIYSQMQSKVK
jgi:hypothetical protein